MSGSPSGRVPADGGVLPVDKPTGPTSHDVVSRARRALSTRRVGHTGTLDPLASGLLLLCVGPATRLSQFIVGADKRYTTTIRLGVETDSLDAEGTVTREDEAWERATEAEARAAVAALVGSQQQVPPAYSAKKVDGEAAHRRARRGEAVELDAVPITIHAAELLRFEPPSIDVSVHVSSGTFVRAIGRDLAAALGTTGHVTALRRTAVGPIDVSKAVSLEDLDRASTLPWITPLEAVRHLPGCSVDEVQARRLAHGQRLDVSDVGPSDLGEVDDWVRIAHEGRLLAIGEIENGALRPRKVFTTFEPVTS